MSFITLTDINGLRVAIEADAVESITDSAEYATTLVRTASGDEIYVGMDFSDVAQLVGEHRSWELVDVVPADDPIGNPGEIVVRRPR